MARFTEEVGIEFRQILVLRPVATLVGPYSGGSFEAVENHVRKLLGGFSGRFKVAALPSQYWLKERDAKSLGALVISLAFHDRQSVEAFRRVAESPAQRGAILAVGSDLQIQGSEFFCPANIDQATFGTRSASNDLIGVDYLQKKGLRGDGVNVVVVDSGVDKSRIPSNYVDGWPHPSGAPKPGMGTPDGHGMMIVRNILGVAPRARIWDLPLIPDRISNIPFFLSDAIVSFLVTLNDIAANALDPKWSGPFVLVNAWAIFDRQSEVPLGDYSNRATHPFNQIVELAVNMNIDVVFSAGNCGQFCPDQRCGIDERWPGQSILGANSHHGVLTVGAVRTDGRWLGYSSQGPGQPNLAPVPPGPNLKPDLCAPSNFSETHDAHTRNAGTSAACAVAAGVLTALRSRKKWQPPTVTPAEMKTILNTSARKLDGTGFDTRIGNGIVDAEAAYKKALLKYP